MDQVEPTGRDPVRLTACRSCGSAALVDVLDLGQQASANTFPRVTDPLPDRTAPLGLCICADCTLLQLTQIWDPGPEIAAAITSATARRHADEACELILEKLDLTAGATFAEFASPHGDGWGTGFARHGLVPADSAPADLVLDVFGIMHDEALTESLAARVEKLRQGGSLVFVTQNPQPMLVAGHFDSIRHGHPMYLTATALTAALQPLGLHLTHVRETPDHGGALIMLASRSGPPDATVAALLAAEECSGVTDASRLGGLAKRAEVFRSRLQGIMDTERTAGRRVFGYGASTRAVVLLGLLGWGSQHLSAIADLSPGKHGHRLPGTDVPIISPDNLIRTRPDTVIILTWDFADEVFSQLSPLADAGTRFYVPLPEGRWLP